jgi:Ras family
VGFPTISFRVPHLLASATLTLPRLCLRTLGFSHVSSWLTDVREHADPHLTCILVGNKVDLCDAGSVSTDKRREVPTEEAETWAKEQGLLFVEASAKSGQNVEEAFIQAASDILGKIRRGVFDDDRVRMHPFNIHARLVFSGSMQSGFCTSNANICSWLYSHQASNYRNRIPI